MARYDVPPTKSSLFQVKADLSIAREVRKTQRRVNALEKVVIPDVLETKGFIEGVLEEREREVFFVQKILKARLGERT